MISSPNLIFWLVQTFSILTYTNAQASLICSGSNLFAVGGGVSTTFQTLAAGVACTGGQLGYANAAAAPTGVAQAGAVGGTTLLTTDVTTGVTAMITTGSSDAANGGVGGKKVVQQQTGVTATPTIITTTINGVVTVITTQQAADSGGGGVFQQATTGADATTVGAGTGSITAIPTTVTTLISGVTSIYTTAGIAGLNQDFQNPPQSLSSGASGVATGSPPVATASGAIAGPRVKLANKRHVSYYQIFDSEHDGRTLVPDYLTGVTHIILFGNDATSTPWKFQASTDSFPSISTMTAKGAQLMVSLGGWLNGAAFDTVLAGGDMTAFATEAVAFMHTWSAVGIDIDYEYPNSGNSANFVLLIKAIRKAAGDGAIISVAIPASLAGKPNDGDKAWSDTAFLTNLAADVDMWNLMTYDETNRMSTITGPLTSYPAMKGAIDFYTTGTGITVSQMNAGFPIYATVFPYYGDCSQKDPTICSMGVDASTPASDGTDGAAASFGNGNSMGWRFNKGDNWGGTHFTVAWFNAAWNVVDSVINTVGATSPSIYYFDSHKCDMYIDDATKQMWTWQSPYAMTQMCEALLKEYPDVSIQSFGIGMDSEPDIPHFKALQGCLGSK